MAKWVKGQSGNPDGRPKGSSNGFTEMRGKFMEVFQQLGGTDGLKAWVEKDPKNQDTFYRLIVQLVPKESNVTLDTTPATPEDRAVQAANAFFAAAMGDRPESGADSEPDTMPH